MKTSALIATCAPLALLAGCTTPYDVPGGQGPQGMPDPYPYPQPYPQPYPTPYPTPYPQYPQPMPTTPMAGTYRAVGNEPFWDLNIGQDMVFTDRGTNQSVVQMTPPVRTGIAGETYSTPRLTVNIVHSPCGDGMSDRTFPDTVTVSVDGRPYRGCGAPASFYSQIGENGLPGEGVGTLAGTEWRVTSINGRAVPPGDYSLRFDPNRLDAKFGCNAMGAGYTTAGSMLTVGALLSTRMACPDMSWETSGSAILSQPMRVDLSNPESMILTNAGGTIVTQKVHR